MLNKNIISISLLVAILFEGCSTMPFGDRGVNNPTKVLSNHNTNSSIIDKINDGNSNNINRLEDISINENSINSNNNESLNYQNQQGFESIFFDYDSYSVKPDMYSHLTFDLTKLKEEYPDTHITLEGNCDEWGSDEYNQALGLKRAREIKKYLVEEGINPNRISLKSYGKLNNICNSHTKMCWAKNRRVDIVVSK